MRLYKAPDVAASPPSSGRGAAAPGHKYSRKQIDAWRGPGVVPTTQPRPISAIAVPSTPQHQPVAATLSTTPPHVNPALTLSNTSPGSAPSIVRHTTFAAAVNMEDCHDHQGGKEYGLRLENLERRLDDMNARFFETGEYKDVEDLEDKLEAYKKKFMEFDTDQSGDINEMKLKMMMEKLGQPKTHLELQRMITEVDTTDTGLITYPDFVAMMLGAKSSVLKLILLFEEKMKPAEKPRGVPPKRDLSSLP